MTRGPDGQRTTDPGRRLRRLAPFDACASYPEIRLAEIRWVLTEAADPDQEEGSWLEMLTTAEQQELRQIEQGLGAHERGYARRLTLVQGLLRWAAPGRQRYLLALATVAGGLQGFLMAVLLWFVAAGRWLLDEIARGGVALEPSAFMALGEMPWTLWDSTHRTMTPVPARHSDSSAAAGRIGSSWTNVVVDRSSVDGAALL